jgi:heme A synthase
METVIELTHRITSGAAGLLSLLLCVTSFRLRPVSSAARLGAVLSVLFMITESLIGAGIVKFELVADNASVERALGISVHLVNTSLLTGALALALWGARRGDAKSARPDRFSAALALGACAVTLAVMMTGAVTALGDTLFPPETDLSALDVLAQDQAAGAHLLQRARAFHPILAVSGSLLIILAMTKISERDHRPLTRRLCRVMITLVCAQVALGVLNIWLSAPGYMQLLHLGLATVSWIALCFVTFSLFDAHPQATTAALQAD